jgi:hypothetical protein
MNQIMAMFTARSAYSLCKFSRRYLLELSRDFPKIVSVVAMENEFPRIKADLMFPFICF